MIYNVSMRELGETKIQAESCYELKDGLGVQADTLSRGGMKWIKTLGSGPLLNMVVAWYLAQPKSERERIAHEGKARLEEILSKPYIDPKNPAEPDDEPEPEPVKSKVDGRAGSAKKLSNNRNADKPVRQNTPSIN